MRELGERLGLFEVALVEPHPCEQTAGPAHAELVAELAEHAQRLLKAGVRFVEVAAGERHEREVLDRPGLTPTIAELAEEVARLDERGLTVGIGAQEDAREAEVTKRLGEAYLVAELTPQRDRVPQGGGGLLEVSLSLEQLAEHAHRLGPSRVIAGAISV